MEFQIPHAYSAIDEQSATRDPHEDPRPLRLLAAFFFGEKLCMVYTLFQEIVRAMKKRQDDHDPKARL